MPFEGQAEDHLLDFSPDGRLIGGAAKNGSISVWDVASGTRLLHRSAHGGAAFSADFRSDSRRLAVSTPQGISIIHLPPVSETCPDWLPDLAEAVGGKRLNASGGFDACAAGDLSSARQAIGRSREENPFSEWATWYIEDAPEKAIAPHTGITRRDYAIELSSSGGLAEQDRAISMDPTNGSIYAWASYLSATVSRPVPRAELLPAASERIYCRPLWPDCDRVGSEVGADLGIACDRP